MDKLPADWVPEQTILRSIIFDKIILHYLICLEVSKSLSFQLVFPLTSDNMVDMESKLDGVGGQPTFIPGYGF